MDRQPNTQYVLSLSYGKDSIATLEAIRLLGYPLDRIVHAEIWATDTISADLPPMVEFKAYADKIIKERYGIEVEHICAMRDGEKLTYEKLFYHKPKRKAERERERETDGNATEQGAERLHNSNGRRSPGSILGFPQVRGIWCNSLLKLPPLQGLSPVKRSVVQGPQNKRSRMEVSARVFRYRRTGRDHKYCAIPRNSGRRAGTNCPAH